MRYDLTAMARRARNPRRKMIVLPDKRPPAMLAMDLYRSSYAPVITAWQAAIPAIMVQYERALSELVTDSPADVEQEIAQAEAGLSRLFMLITPRLREWAIKVETWHRGAWRGAVLSATGVDLGTMLGPADMRVTLESAIAWNASLVKDVSKQIEQRIATAAFEGLRNRRPAREVAKAMNEATGLGKKRSLRVAQDQMAKLAGSLADERRREAGLDVWKWRHSGKKHPREDHKARDGRLYADTTADADPERKILPPPPDRPAQLPYCGCRGQGVIIFD